MDLFNWCRAVEIFDETVHEISLLIALSSNGCKSNGCLDKLSQMHRHARVFTASLHIV